MLKPCGFSDRPKPNGSRLPNNTYALWAYVDASSRGATLALLSAVHFLQTHINQQILLAVSELYVSQSGFILLNASKEDGAVLLQGVRFLIARVVFQLECGLSQVQMG